MGKLDFLNQPAPENYVAGLGRGATGFTTRSDLGPTRSGPSEAAIQDEIAKRAKELGQPAPAAYGVTEKKDDEEEDRYQDPDDEVGLFANGFYDKDDDEADRIYQSVDDKMAKRRKAARELREQKEREEFDANNPKISQQFADVKRALASVTDEEWANIPDVGDMTGRNKRARIERQNNRFYAVPDSVIARAVESTQMETSISTSDGNATEEGTTTNFTSLGEARNKILGFRLDRAEKSGTETGRGTATTIDPKGYLTSLDKSVSEMGATVGDIARTRALLESVIKTNPKYAVGWISAARLEEIAGKVVAARNIASRGCQNCPKSEDMWLESIRLHREGDNHNSKVIVADALQHVPRSLELWIAAIELESDPRAKKRVVRKAIDQLPQSVALWKIAANLEDDPADAKLLLARAVDFIPRSVELWLALARLETKENARKVLNRARKNVPNSHKIWIAGARLSAQLGESEEVVNKMMARAVKALDNESTLIKREEWIADAEELEATDSPITCAAVIAATMKWGLDESDYVKTWKSEAESAVIRGHYVTARAIYKNALAIYYNDVSLWNLAIDHERAHGTKEDILALLEKATHSCPGNDKLWMSYATELQRFGELEKARSMLGRAFQQNKSEAVFLAAAKLETDAECFDQARTIFTTARQNPGTNRIWMKSVVFERELKNNEVALDLVNEAIDKFPTFPKLYMLKGQMYEDQQNIPKARESYNAGIRACSHSVTLWLLLAQLEEKAGVTIKARAVLERARLENPKSDRIWVEAIRFELRQKQVKQANLLMAMAQQQIKNSGLLWSERILRLEQRTSRKQRALEAVKLVDNDVHLFICIARIFWSERRLEKAASWFERAIKLNEDFGDTWAWYYKFLIQHGTDEKKVEVMELCKKVAPKHGEAWQSVAKAVGNRNMNTEQILRETVKLLK